jgi:hypothetical protein
MKHNIEQLEAIYKSHVNSENGKIVMADLENFLLKKTPFFAEDIREDAMLREGARHLLNYIYYQLGDE